MRLIDADELVKLLKASTMSNGTLINTNTMLAVVEKMPPAYDVQKVVKELEEWSFETKILVQNNNELGEYEEEIERKIICTQNAIEIVNQGGVSDDVCEWRLCDEEANVYDTSCRNTHILIEGTPRENNYEYCPYCGKKIKVVE